MRSRRLFFERGLPLPGGGQRIHARAVREGGLLVELESAELRATLSYLGRVNRRTLGPRVTWDSLWGRYDARAAEVCLRDVKGAS